MNWEAACAHANALAKEGQNVLVIDTIAMPTGHLCELPNLTRVALSADEVPHVVLSENIDAVIVVTPSRPWAPRKVSKGGTQP